MVARNHLAWVNWGYGEPRRPKKKRGGPRPKKKKKG